MGPGCRTGGFTGIAGNRELQLDGGLAAQHRLLEVDVDDDLDVGSSRRSTASGGSATEGVLTEERLEDVAEGIVAEALAARPRCAEPVVLAPLLRIAENLVGGCDLLEATFCLFITRVRVRVVLAGQAPIRLLDVICRSRARDFEHLVEVVVHAGPSRRWDPSCWLTRATVAIAWA